MSFHKDEFHETKRERKYFEHRKQLALKAIEKLGHDLDVSYDLSQQSRDRIAIVWDLVNNI